MAGRVASVVTAAAGIGGWTFTSEGGLGNKREPVLLDPCVVPSLDVVEITESEVEGCDEAV